MEDLFFDLNYKLKFNWDLDTVLRQLSTIISHPDNLFEIYSDPSGKPHWQSYTDAYFSRNLYKSFTAECNNIIDQLKELQEYTYINYRNCNNHMVDAFIKHKIVPQRLSLIKIKAGTNVVQHTDRRHIALNVGLQNSNSCVTCFSRLPDLDKFWDSPIESFIMQDNNACLLHVSKNHAVKSLVSKESNLDRVIITYTVVDKNEM